MENEAKEPGMPPWLREVALKDPKGALVHLTQRTKYKTMLILGGGMMLTILLALLIIGHFHISPVGLGSLAGCGGLGAWALRALRWCRSPRSDGPRPW